MEPTDAVTLAQDKLAEHGLEDWEVTLGKTKNIFGRCWHSSGRIELSKPLVEANDHDMVHGVILHEIAHALAGHKAGHGPEWKRIARRIGVKNPKCTTQGAKHAAFKWTGTCRCGKEYGRNRLSKNLRTAVCRRCLTPLQWRKNA